MNSDNQPKDDIQDELNAEADALMKEIVEEDEAFRQDVEPRIDKLGNRVDNAIGELDATNDELAKIVDESAKKADKLVDGFEKEAAEVDKEEESLEQRDAEAV